MGASGFFDYPTSDPDELAPAAAARTLDQPPFLHDADEREWDALLAFTQTRNLDPAEIVFAEGAIDRALYLLTIGRLELSSGGGQIGELIAPASVNEIGFLDRGLCAVTATAVVPSEILRLSFEAFESLAAREPVLARKLLLEVGRVVALSLRAT